MIQATARGVCSTTAKAMRANTLCSKTSWPTLYSFCSRIVGMLMRNVSTRHSTLSGQARVSTPSRERNPTTALP